RAFAALALADGAGEPAAEAADRLVRLARRIRAGERRPLAVRLGVLAGRLAERAGDPNKLTDARRFARTTMEEIRRATPEHHRAGLQRDPDALWAPGSETTRAGDPAG